MFFDECTTQYHMFTYAPVDTHLHVNLFLFVTEGRISYNSPPLIACQWGQVSRSLKNSLIHITRPLNYLEMCERELSASY